MLLCWHGSTQQRTKSCFLCVDRQWNKIGGGPAGWLWKRGENEEGKGGSGLLMMALWLTFSVRASHVRECPNLNKTAENAQQNAPIPAIRHECENWEYGFYSFLKHRYCMLCFPSKWQVKYENSSALLWMPHTHKAELKTQECKNGY